MVDPPMSGNLREEIAVDSLELRFGGISYEVSLCLISIFWGKFQ